MNRLLKFEFRKLFRQKSFYICGAVLVGLILLSAITMNMLLQLTQSPVETAEGVSVIMNEAGISFSGLYLLATSLSQCDFSIVLAVFIALFVCNDYNNGTLKNIIARGYGRTKIYASKYIVSLIAATLLTVFCWLTGFLSGTAFWGVGTLAEADTTWNFISILLVQLLAVYAYTSLFFLISALLKKTGGSIAVGILAPLVMAMGISLIDALIHSDTFKISDYWLDTCFNQISAVSVASDVMLRCLVCFLIYTVVFGVIGHLVGSRNEV